MKQTKSVNFIKMYCFISNTSKYVMTVRCDCFRFVFEHYSDHFWLCLIMLSYKVVPNAGHKHTRLNEHTATTSLLLFFPL